MGVNIIERYKRIKNTKEIVFNDVFDEFSCLGNFMSFMGGIIFVRINQIPLA